MADEQTPVEESGSVLEQRYGVPFIDLTTFKLDSEVLQLFPEEFLRKNKLIPLFRSGNTLAVAMVDPGDIFTIDEVRRTTGMEVEPMVCREIDLYQALNQYYAAPEPADIPDEPEVTSLDDLPEEESAAVAEQGLEPRKLEEMASEAPVVRWVNQMIIRAVRERASDIHIEPTREGLRVRFRIDGILHPIVSPKKALQLAVVSRIKIMSKMNIAEKRVPQDGRYGAIVDGREIDFRVSTFPTTYGEKVVMRILDRMRLLSLDELGLVEESYETLREMIAKPHGVILITGPTGSGKSTTLYAILNEIRSSDKNIITIEDPVEYDIDDICQSQVNERAGYTYLVGLRHILRQDPDVIMIGEIRDAETAGVAIRAALTGQLVFSTIHTNDAPGTVTRLIDMGIEPFLVASGLEGVVAQRLVRRICPKCKVPYDPPAKMLEEFDLPPGTKFYKGKGCEHCRNTGYRGRMGIFEVMKLNDRIRELVVTRPPTSAIRALAREYGMKTLWEDGMRKVLNGVTTIEEVMDEAEKVE
ncbi:MAG: GspE/PulE family protein [candidate division WOR-3 bacterium]|jgi:type IV pilus assembly protein PilB|nr:GspE/PulE family protein [candidate division WOR-3 bacterium]MCR4423903.1 GspE/PulE family protein [candidate division WOR-3 bacterium]MDH7519241.1 GspE/PulE family protein [bacterium]